MGVWVYVEREGCSWVTWARCKRNTCANVVLCRKGFSRKTRDYTHSNIVSEFQSIHACESFRVYHSKLPHYCALTGPPSPQKKQFYDMRVFLLVCPQVAVYLPRQLRFQGRTTTESHHRQRHAQTRPTCARAPLSLLSRGWLGACRQIGVFSARAQGLTRLTMPYERGSLLNVADGTIRTVLVYG